MRRSMQTTHARCAPTDALTFTETDADQVRNQTQARPNAADARRRTFLSSQGTPSAGAPAHTGAHRRRSGGRSLTRRHCRTGSAAVCDSLRPARPPRSAAQQPPLRRSRPGTWPRRRRGGCCAALRPPATASPHLPLRRAPASSSAARTGCEMRSGALRMADDALMRNTASLHLPRMLFLLFLP